MNLVNQDWKNAFGILVRPNVEVVAFLSPLKRLGNSVGENMGFDGCSVI